MRKLSALNPPPSETFLILQLEAAQKWGGVGHETVVSVLLKSKFAVQPVLALHRSSFAPRPRVDALLLKLEPRLRPLVSQHEARHFEQFVRRRFGEPRLMHRRLTGHREPLPSELTVEEWVELFRMR